MTPPVPPLRIRQAPPRVPGKTPRVRISIGSTYRDMPLIDARHIADRIHDTCDRAESPTTPHQPRKAQP